MSHHCCRLRVDLPDNALQLASLSFGLRHPLALAAERRYVGRTKDAT
jgi:hypothetical protein